MKIYQYHNIIDGNYRIGKIHVIMAGIAGNFLCGKYFDSNIDINDLNKIDSLKGICGRCSQILKNKHKKDLSFEFIKWKFGIKI